MRIIGIERDASACNHYRILQPLYKMRNNELADVLTLGEGELQSDYAVEKVMEADIVVFQRSATKAWFDFIKKCQGMGKIIVCDYDDDPFDTHPMNPHYQVSGTKEYKYEWENGEIEWLWRNGENGFNIEENIERMDMFRASFKQSDLVTTTTGVLANTFKKVNESVAVLPNLIDFGLYEGIPEMKKKKVRIGYQGGNSHYPDLFMIIGQIEEVMKENDNVEFVFMGDYRFKDIFKNLPQDRFEFHSWVKHNSYPYKLALLNLDIGLCPVVDNNFNRQKSAIKHFEYTMVGASTISSNIPPYSEVIDKEGLLVNPLEWKDALTELIKDKDKRSSTQKKAYDRIYQDHNADTKAHLWVDAYNKILHQDIKI